jgi:hypothetical protein
MIGTQEALFDWLFDRLLEAEPMIDVTRVGRCGPRPDRAGRAERWKKAIPTFQKLAAEVIAVEQAKSTKEKVRYQWELLLGPINCARLLNRHRG